MVGQFRWNDPDKHRRDGVASFMIVKRSLTKLQFEDEEFVDEFYVEIKNGKVTDYAKMISLQAESKKGHFFKDVHEIISTQ